MEHMTRADKKILNRTILIGALAMLATVAVTIDNNIEENKEKEAQKKEEMAQNKRAAEFAQYLLDDIEKVVDKKTTRQAINDMMEIYKRNPERVDKMIEKAVADSAKYANAIVRDASFIKDKKTISFEQAKKIVESQQALVYGPKYRTDVYVHEGAGLHGEDVTEYVQEPTGEMEVKGSNTSRERKIKINSKHLTNTMIDLGVMRAAKNKAKDN